MFISGWLNAIDRWKSGVTWEDILTEANSQPDLFGAGMRAAVDAMSGWLDSAEKAAKANDCSPERISELMRRAKGA